jgi:hypothetical protein
MSQTSGDGHGECPMPHHSIWQKPVVLSQTLVQA